MFYHLLIAVVGVTGLLGVWIGVQALVRRGSPEFAPDADVLACRTCGTPDDCHSCSHGHDLDLDRVADGGTPPSDHGHQTDVT